MLIVLILPSGLGYGYHDIELSEARIIEIDPILRTVADPAQTFGLRHHCKELCTLRSSPNYVRRRGVSKASRSDWVESIEQHELLRVQQNNARLSVSTFHGALYNIQKGRDALSIACGTIPNDRYHVKHSSFELPAPQVMFNRLSLFCDNGPRFLYLC